MLAPIIVLYVASAEIDAATTAAMARALDLALAASGAVTVRAAPATAGPSALEITCGDPNVAGAAAVTWDSRDKLRATVLVRHCKSGDEGSFHLSFGPRDPAVERGRAVGIVIASALHVPAETAPPLPPPPAPETNPARVVTARAERPPPARRGYSLDAFALGGVPIGGDGGGIGGGLAVRVPIRGRWGLRFGLQGRSGQIGVAQASIFESGLAAGVTHTLLTHAQGAMPAVGLRVDLSLLYESTTHFSSDDADPVRRQRVFPAVDGRVELTWPFGPIDLQVSTGPQAALAEADVLVRGKKVTEIPIWRAILEMGFRVGF